MLMEATPRGKRNGTNVYTPTYRGNKPRGAAECNEGINHADRRLCCDN